MMLDAALPRSPAGRWLSSRSRCAGAIC